MRGEDRRRSRRRAAGRPVEHAVRRRPAQRRHGDDAAAADAAAAGRIARRGAEEPAEVRQIRNRSTTTGQAQNFGPLQFDTKGVEFGPWIRRFVSQVRRNWFVPMAAMSHARARGDHLLRAPQRALTDVKVIQPSEIESFNTAAVNALLASNPTEPLPPEYPDDKAFFTVTFY